MTQRKFWHRALVGGFGKHLDWLAVTMIAGIAGSTFDPVTTSARRHGANDDSVQAKCK